MRSFALISLFLTFLGAIGSVSAHAIPAERSPSDYYIRVKEIAWCLAPWRSVSCVKAQGHANTATAEAETLFPTSLRDGAGDAFRHCYWNARMTIDIGAGTAKAIGDNHEAVSDGTPAAINMDLANNESGRGYGLRASGTTDKAKYANAKAACKRAAETGQLVTL